MGNQLKLLRFSPCYKSVGGIDIDRKDTFPQRGETKEYDNTSYQPPLAYNKCFTWVVNRADGSNLDISEFEHETEQEAIEEAQQCINDWYENE